MLFFVASAVLHLLCTAVSCEFYGAAAAGHSSTSKDVSSNTASSWTRVLGSEKS